MVVVREGSMERSRCGDGGFGEKIWQGQSIRSPNKKKSAGSWLLAPWASLLQGEVWSLKMNVGGERARERLWEVSVPQTVSEE